MAARREVNEAVLDLEVAAFIIEQEVQEMIKRNLFHRASSTGRMSARDENATLIEVFLGVAQALRKIAQQLR